MDNVQEKLRSIITCIANLNGIIYDLESVGLLVDNDSFHGRLYATEDILLDSCYTFFRDMNESERVKVNTIISEVTADQVDNVLKELLKFCK